MMRMQDDVDQRHDGSHPLGDAGHGTDAAEDDDGGEHENEPRDDQLGGAQPAETRQRRLTPAPESRHQGPGDGVGLHGGDDETAGDHGDRGEDRGESPVAHAAGHVEGGTAAE